MKTRFFIFLGLLTLIFTSCDLNNESNNTPEIYFYKDPVVNRTKALGKYLADYGILKLDTIYVGDTVSFQMYFYAYANNITSINITQSTDSLTQLVFPKDSIYFLPTSDFEKGKLLAAGTYSDLIIPFKYIARKVGLNAYLTFNVVSDAKFKDLSGENSRTVILKTPIATTK